MDALINFLKSHGIEVISNTPETILCNTRYCVNGKAHYEQEWIEATWSDVRDYLGY